MHNMQITNIKNKEDGLNWYKKIFDGLLLLREKKKGKNEVVTYIPCAL